MRFTTSFGCVLFGHVILYIGGYNSLNDATVLAFTALPTGKNHQKNIHLYSTANDRKGSSQRNIATAVLSPPSVLKESHTNNILKKNPSSEECISKTTTTTGGLQSPMNNNEDSSQEEASDIESVDTVNEEEEEGYDEEQKEEDTKSMAVKAALERQRKKLVLLGRSNQRGRQKQTTKKNTATTTKQGQKVPPRRTLSAASRARSNTSMPSSTTLLKGIRTAAAAAAAASKRTNDDEKNSPKKIDNQKKSATGLSSMTKSVIQSTINYMLQTQSNTSVIQKEQGSSILSRSDKSPHDDPFGVSQWYLEYDNTRKDKLNNNNNNNDKQMGVLGEPVTSDSVPLAGRMENEPLSIKKKDVTSIFPGFGYVLIPPIEQRTQESNDSYTQADSDSTSSSLSSAYSHQKLVRVATPKDDVVIANLRMSVFSGFNNEMRQKFCLKSCQVLHSRRMKGATCLVSTCRTTDSRNKEIVLGSAECSTHEFSNTEIGKRRDGGSIMYITEFAVHPKVRGSGTGTMLLQGIDELARKRNVETLYLHVDVTNDIACHLYKKAGYKIIQKSCDPIYHEFTTSLNLHDGATKGRNHFLMYKHLVTNPTWLESDENIVKEPSILGFQI